MRTKCREISPLVTFCAGILVAMICPIKWLLILAVAALVLFGIRCVKF